MGDSKPCMLDAARGLLDVGLSVVPAHLALKYPAIRHWKPYQSKLPTMAEVNAWFSNGQDAVCIITGAVSGNLEMLDFDLAGEAFEKWKSLVEKEEPSLPDRLVIETSPSGGFHIVYRSETPVSGNLKLAQRGEFVEGPDPVVIHGKKYLPRQDKDGRWHVLLTLIETRGEGGLFLCAPSPGYCLIQKDFSALPVLTKEEREILLEAAWSLNEHFTETACGAPVSDACTGRPGDDFNARGDVRALLARHGWTLAVPGENEYWRRPGKDRGWSATFKDRVFYVFSSSAPPFEPNRAYSPFSVYAMLEHGGDFQNAASRLRAEGYGDDVIVSDVDMSGFDPPGDNDGEAGSPDPGSLPDELLRVPGFVSEVMDHCLETAPYPNQVMAFAGALALQSFLAGRKVRDPGDNRTNIYLLGLGHSGTGKDWPRKINTKIIHEVGLSDSLGERFASGEGIQDALFIKPCMLFQTDEIDGMLQTINKAKDARHENIMGTLLTMYSASNSVYPMRRKAGQESPGAIDQPCLVIFGTAIPNHYYEALSERMLTNGFFARMIILESAKRLEGQDPKILPLPARIIETAKWWSEFHPGTGNLEKWHPVPKIVEHTEEAAKILAECRREAEAEYSAAEVRSDSVGTTVWSRVNEQARKLALLYAVSENHLSPVIGKSAAEWACRFSIHQTRRMLFMAQGYVADNPFHADCLKVIQKLEKAPENMLLHSVLLKRMKMPTKKFDEIIQTLLQWGAIRPAPVQTKGRSGVYYKLEKYGLL